MCYCFGKVFAEADIVAAVFHGNGNADGRLSVKINFGFGRVGITAGDFGNVIKAENAPVGINRDAADFFKCIRQAGKAQVNIVVGAFCHTGGYNCRLRFYGAGKRIKRNAKRRKFIVGDFQINFFRLHADKFNFFYVWHGIKNAFNFFGFFTHILVTETFGGDCVYIAVYIVETVVKIRSVNAFRQVCFNIVYNIAQFQPVAAYLIGWNMLFKVNINNALPRARITCNVINIRQGLGFFFNFICNLHFHFFGCCAGPCSRYNHLLNRIYRVFRAAENVIGINAGNKAKKHEKVNYLFMFNRP